MYQFNMSVDAVNKAWILDIEKVLSLKVKSCSGLIALKESAKRLNLSIACENKYKNDIVIVLKDCITEIFLTVVKRGYLSEKLNTLHLKHEAFKILLHTLVAFDRDMEKEIIIRNLKFIDNLALDGLFNFKLFELKKRWDDIADLAVNNSSFLNNDETLNELLKFLMSSISPKINKLEVIKQKNQYFVSGEYLEKSFEYSISSSEQLMMYLINIAPLELVLKGNFEDDKLYKRLVCIFDAKELLNNNVTI